MKDEHDETEGTFCESCEKHKTNGRYVDNEGTFICEDCDHDWQETK